MKLKLYNPAEIWTEAMGDLKKATGLELDAESLPNDKAGN
jgi:hypothetical protein